MVHAHPLHLLTINTFLRGTVIACQLNAPGSWHDLRVAQTIYQKLCSHMPDGVFLVADTAFPQGSTALWNGGFIHVPMKAGERLQMMDKEM